MTSASSLNQASPAAHDFVRTMIDSGSLVASRVVKPDHPGGSISRAQVDEIAQIVAASVLVWLHPEPHTDECKLKFAERDVLVCGPEDYGSLGITQEKIQLLHWQVESSVKEYLNKGCFHPSRPPYILASTFEPNERLAITLRESTIEPPPRGTYLFPKNMQVAVKPGLQPKDRGLSDVEVSVSFPERFNPFTAEKLTSFWNQTIPSGKRARLFTALKYKDQSEFETAADEAARGIAVSLTSFVKVGTDYEPLTKEQSDAFIKHLSNKISNALIETEGFECLPKDWYTLISDSCTHMGVKPLNVFLKLKCQFSATVLPRTIRGEEGELFIRSTATVLYEDRW